MRTLIVHVLLFLFSGCAHQAHQHMKGDAQSDLFAGESLLRVGEKVEARPDACYHGDLASFTEQARQQYAQGAKTALYWNGVGNCLAWHGETREARFFLGLAMNLAKTKEEEAMVKNNLAVLDLRQGRVSRAYDLFSEARALAPRLVTPGFNLAQLYVSQGMNAEALKILTLAPFGASTDGEVLHLRALALLQSGQVKEAGAFLNRVPSSLAQRGDVAVTTAHWHVREGRPEAALAALDNRQKNLAPGLETLAQRISLEARAQIAAKEAK